MNSTDINKISFDNLLANSTYVNTVLDNLPEDIVSSEKKTGIIHIFKYLLKGLSEKELDEIMSISRLYKEKMEDASSEYAFIHAMYIYDTFLEKMLFDSSVWKKCFNIMNENIKISVDYQKSKDFASSNRYYQTNYDTVGNIR